MTRFSRISLQVMKNGSFITKFNARGSWLPRMNLLSLHQRRSQMEELCIWWYHRGIIHFEFLNYRLLMQTWTPNSSSFVDANLRKRLLLDNRRNVELLYENGRPHSRKITREKYWIKVDLFYPVHYIQQTLHHVIFIILDLNKIFWM